mmetsp:Transcript_27531/g.53487  ORF Transcript_27531/g.53487 Transcript_27531/m.53487 type:complete len:253 (+) Transcript_27531:449-1207(+)
MLRVRRDLAEVVELVHAHQQRLVFRVQGAHPQSARGKILRERIHHVRTIAQPAASFCCDFPEPHVLNSGLEDPRPVDLIRHDVHALSFSPVPYLLNDFFRVHDRQGVVWLAEQHNLRVKPLLLGFPLSLLQPLHRRVVLFWRVPDMVVERVRVYPDDRCARLRLHVELEGRVVRPWKQHCIAGLGNAEEEIVQYRITPRGSNHVVRAKRVLSAIQVRRHQFRQGALQHRCARGSLIVRQVCGDVLVSLLEFG